MTSTELQPAPLVVSPDIESLALKIKAEYEAATASFSRGFEHALACGQLLIEAKAKVGHGNWLLCIRKLQQESGIKLRTAQLFMQLARAYPRLGSNAQRVAYLTVREAITQISLQTHRIARLPAPAVDAALSECDEGRLMGAVRRAESVEQHRRSMLWEEERQREKRVVAESAPLESWQSAPSWSEEEERFIAELSAAVRNFMTEQPDIGGDRVCDLLNEVYCMVQDGRISADPAEQPAPLRQEVDKLVDGVLAKAETAKRGRGRPPGSKNKPKEINRGARM